LFGSKPIERIRRLAARGDGFCRFGPSSADATTESSTTTTVPL
jgi:hypothetical protein